MGKMTSTPYGLKVKEHTNHADYKDIFEDVVFKIYYNESTHVWTIKSNYDRLWSEGTQYFKGDTILEFTNTLTQEKTVLGQYDQEGTEVYRNIMYRIKCYQGEAGAGATKQLIQITGGYSPKTYDKDTVCTDILHTHVSVYYNGKWHKAMYLVYDNASIAGCWMKKVGSLAITYAYPYWFLMCTKTGLKQGDRTYAARELIRSWSQDDYINMSFKEYKIRSKTKLGKGSYEKGEYLVKTIPSEDSIEVDFIVNGKIENKDTIILGISDVPYNFYNIRITYESNKWSLISINGHISYNKHNYKKDAVICTLNKNEQITVTLIDNNDRYEKQQELNDDYEETVYDIVGLPDSTYITVKNQTVVQELNPETGRTEKVYIDFDEKIINQSDTMPSDFYNIRFVYTSIDNQWTIYSLCDYIKYGGRTYTKNKPILNFRNDEYDPEDPHPEVHLEIKDETEKYEIESTTTYTVKSVQVSDISYKLWTVTIDKSLKIEKTIDTTVEPWISLRYYEAMYEPIVIDDLILEFSNVDMKWYLKSNNDNLYCAGTNYQKGELITYWDYNYIQNLKYITVLSSSSEYGIELKKLTSGDVPYISEDIDEIYDEGLKICYSVSKGLWEIISVDDETYYNGIQFLEGQTIVSFKDKTILDQFTILVKKIIPGEEEYDNVMYTCYTGVDLINGITTLTVNGMSWTDKSATDANKSVIVTKDTARSMYGYIWQKETSPGPTPTPDMYRYYIIPAFIPDNYRDSGLYGNGYRYIALIRVEFGHRFVKKVAYNGYYNRINALDEFEIFNDDLMYSLNMNSGKGMYKYYKWYSGGPADDDDWSYSYEFPYNSGNYTIYYHSSNTKITFGFSRYYTDENGEGWRIIKRVYNDEYLIDYTEYTNEIFYQDWVGFPLLDHKCNEYFNGEKHYYSVVNGIMSYIDKGDYLLLFGNSCLADSRDVTIENRCISAKLYVNNLEFTSFNTQVPIDLQALRSDAISRGLPNNNRTQASLSSALMTVEKYQLYYVVVSNSEPWFMTDPFKVIYTYKYDVEENTIVQKDVYKIYDIVNNFIDPNKMYDVPWHIPDVISSGKGYSYYRTPNGEKLEVYEIEDPYNFENIYSGGQKVAEYNLNELISIFNLTTKVASQFTYDALFYTTRAYNNSSAVSKCEYYDTSINKFLSTNDKKGMFRYVFNNIDNVDPMIVYFPDPTLEDISSAFFFKTSDLRYSSEINEEVT